MPFMCSGCGACCMDVRHIPDLAPWAEESGRCSKLGSDDKTCTIYADRPLICNVDAMGKQLRLTQESWYFVNRHGCEFLHRQLYGAPLEPADEDCQHGKARLPRTTVPPDTAFPSLLGGLPDRSPRHPPEE